MLYTSACHIIGENGIVSMSSTYRANSHVNIMIFVSHKYISHTIHGFSLFPWIILGRWYIQDLWWNLFHLKNPRDITGMCLHIKPLSGQMMPYPSSAVAEYVLFVLKNVFGDNICEWLQMWLGGGWVNIPVSYQHLSPRETYHIEVHGSTRWITNSDYGVGQCIMDVWNAASYRILYYKVICYHYCYHFE